MSAELLKVYGNPRRVQLSRAKGWRMPEKTVSIARPGRWGNPFRVDVYGRNLAITLFERSVQGFWSPDGIPDRLIELAYLTHMELQEKRREYGMDPTDLRGYDLACWCPAGRRCHGDVLLELANA